MAAAQHIAYGCLRVPTGLPRSERDVPWHAMLSYAMLLQVAAAAAAAAALRIFDPHDRPPQLHGEPTFTPRSQQQGPLSKPEHLAPYRRAHLLP